MKRRKIFWFSPLAAFALILSACGGSSKEPTPTPVDPNLIAAQAIATFAMSLTQTAFAQPTATFTSTPEPSPTNTFAPLVTNTPAGVVPTSSADVSVWIKDLTYDDTVTIPTLNPGEQFVKKWLVQNAGTATWTANYKIAFGGIGIPMGGQTTPLGKVVRPGEQVEIAITFIAPTAPGEYKSYWKMQNEQGVFFGTWLTATIKVAGAPAATATAAATATPTETPTPTP